VALARSPSLNNLVTLNLNHNNFNAAAVAALRERFGERVQL
jgi:hypothetical protein